MITREQIKRIRVETNFDRTYAKLGGTAKLLDMASHFVKLEDMAAYFGVTKNRISQVLIVLMGKRYTDYLGEHDVHRSGVTYKEVV